MSEKVRSEAHDFVKFLRELPAEERNRAHQAEIARADAQHREFQNAFNIGRCYLCGDALTGFNIKAPCIHWLLKPVGLTKHHFPRITSRYGLFQIQAFLRWLANEEGFARNINDLSDEGTGKLVEVTIRYGECEWAFSCALNDYMGHEDGGVEASRRPHYHFQMRHRHQAFIRYNEFHTPLSDEDIINIESRRSAPDFIRQRWAGGEGMGDVLTDETVEGIIEHTTPTDSEEDGTFNIQTLIMAPDGEKLSGEQLMALFDEAKATGKTVASLVRKRLPEASAQTFVTPAGGVVEQAPRTPHKRGGGNE